MNIECISGVFDKVGISSQGNDNIGSIEKLNALLDGGLDQLYADVFADPPYNENFSTDEVRNIFQGYLKDRGLILVAGRDVLQPQAFIVATPCQSDFARICGVKEQDIPKTAYIAEDGVHASMRRLGVSSMMKREILNMLSQCGYTDVLLRTSEQNTPQIRAVEKIGGTRLPNAKQTVERITKFGKVMDKSCFFRFQLK
jgi:ribosomal protein S18 acetylase RimI-like enzyme